MTNITTRFPGLGLRPRPGFRYNESMTYFRINQPGHAPEAILDPENQHSYDWAGDDVRDGISACETIEDLGQYMAQVGIPLDDCTLICFDGYEADEDDLDSDLGAVLTIPTCIEWVMPLDDCTEFWDAWSDAADQLMAA